MTPSIINKAPYSFGLKDDDVETIVDIISQHDEIDEAIIFGSRAKGNYKTGSDIDIALKGSKVNHVTTGNLSYLLNEETLMPYKFDVLNYHTVTNEDLMKHIDRVGVSFFKRRELL